ncbi:MAG: kinase [Candidatus Aureabacteria bacterium]|nr:kinase [Candidatus Auribacterota bacterium]
MIISRTPFRISFFGGGTDYPSWFRVHGGAVLASAINKYCYISCRYLPPFFSHKSRIVWSRIELCRDNRHIIHPAAREVLKHLHIDRGVEIHHEGDIPARSGMGSSSAFTVGLLHALYALKGAMPAREVLARESIFIEREILKETVGVQDQILAAYGGFKHITISQSDDYVLRPMTLPSERIEELNSHLMLFYTGIVRTASKVAQSYVPTLTSRENVLKRICEMVDEGIAILNGRDDIISFGKLLHEYWRLKSSLSAKISNKYINEIYESAISSGAIGGKVTGAGGGGFILLFAPPPAQKKIREKLKRLLYVPFKFESSGSRIIFFEPEEDHSTLDRARSGHPHSRKTTGRRTR